MQAHRRPLLRASRTPFVAGGTRRAARGATRAAQRQAEAERQQQPQAAQEAARPDALSSDDPPAVSNAPSATAMDASLAPGLPPPPAAPANPLADLLSRIDWSEPISFDGEEKTEYDPLRDGPLRYLGYANELGEAFAAWLFAGGVPLSYAVRGPVVRWA